MVDIDNNPPWFRNVSQCRYSGLPVSSPQIYISKHPGTNYFVDIAKIGDEIVLVQGAGDVRSYEMAEALSFMDEYISKYFDIKTGVFMIENYADIGRVDYKARKLYIDHHKNSNVFWGGIFYSMSRLMQFSFKVSQRLHIQDNNVYAVDSYKQAISLAEELVSHRNDGDILKPDNDSGFQSFSKKRSATAQIISTRATGVFNYWKNRFFCRTKENISRDYSEALLKYIESIDWHKDGINVPETIDAGDKSIQKVFEAISYIKSEIDDLLKERDASDKILRESEARYRQLVEHAKAGIIEFDYKANRITSVNDSFLEISGYSNEEVSAMNPLELMTEESREIFVERLSQRLEGKILSPDISYQFHTKSGRKIWVLLNANVTYKDECPQKAAIVLIDITPLKKIEHELISYQSKLKQLSVQLSRAEENQRRQLASRLHESVSQELFAAQLKLNVLGKSLDDPKYSRQVDDIKGQIVKSIQDIRGITYDLSPPVLYDLGLKEAVESLAKSIESKYHLPVKARFSGSFDHIDEEIKIITYRVIREIVQNSVKHSDASFVDIIIDNINDTLNVDVTDNGVGFDSDGVSGDQYTGDGFGLFDIREKINHLGGDVTIRSTPGSGTRIGLSIPLDDTSPNALKN